MRKLLSVATALTVLASVPGQAFAADKYVIGLVTSLTGPFATVGQSMQRGAELAVELRGKVRGRPIELIEEDDETKPQNTVQKASKLLASGVDLMVGSVASGATLAMMKAIARKKVPHIVSVSGSDDITGSEMTPYTFRVSDPNALYISTTVSFALDHHVKKLYTLALDVGTNRDAIEAISAELQKKGVEIVGNDSVPLASTDYAVVVDKVSKSGADAVVMYGGGDPGIAFVKQAAQIGLAERMLVFGPTLMNEVVANAVGEVKGNIYSSVRYQFAIDNPANKAFVAAYRKKFNEWPSEEAGETFDGITWFLDVVENSKSDDPQAWIEEFSKSTYSNSVEGVKVMRTCDHQATKPGYWTVREKGAPPLPAYYMKIVNTYPPESIWKPCP